ncbi:N-acetylglutamate synthase, GNAT family [Kaistia soli DSM 19436]|uniref:N-acetylglutamate synthase, GNAT family n=1 Tax=Kaistia soli DSM 19436 TaxID=1122133 RepID=A0A1M5JFZ2_9HYPH|nr:GNAT family N-acetyltransferase [Kaistia soli]SHG38963.1 N-acetylglutamate synthase, GNAT family [Kaistia soli DSM 19436]
MPDSIVLRQAAASDRDALVAMQRAAYEPNRTIIGGTPTPLSWDYDAVLDEWEVWLAEDEAGLCGALILEARPDELYIQSVAVAPAAKGRGVGNRLLAYDERRALQTSRDRLTLTANALMTFNIDWYGRKGFVVYEIEMIGQRRRVHMAKALHASALPPP